MSIKKGFKESQNCSQSVITYFTDKLGMDQDSVLKMSLGFGGGMGALQRTCGVVSGGIMAIGLLNSKPSDENNKSNVYKNVREFVEDFEAEVGSSSCFTILEDNDMRTDEGKQIILDKDLRNQKCAKCIDVAIEIIERKYS